MYARTRAYARAYVCTRAHASVYTRIGIYARVYASVYTRACAYARARIRARDIYARGLKTVRAHILMRARTTARLQSVCILLCTLARESTVLLFICCVRSSSSCNVSGHMCPQTVQAHVNEVDIEKSTSRYPLHCCLHTCSRSNACASMCTCAHTYTYARTYMRTRAYTYASVRVPITTYPSSLTLLKYPYLRRTFIK